MWRLHTLATAAILWLAPVTTEVSHAPQSSASGLAFNVTVPEVQPRLPAPAASNSTGFRPADGPLKSNSASDGLFYVTAMVNGKPVRFVVDTGASVVILTQADAIRAGVSRTSGTAMNVDTAGGSSAMHAVSLGRVDIAGQSLTDVDAAIMASDLQVSLLGQSVLSQMRSVQLTGNRLQLN